MGGFGFLIVALIALAILVLLWLSFRPRNGGGDGGGGGGAGYGPDDPDSGMVLPPPDLKKPELANILGWPESHEFRPQELVLWREITNRIISPQSRSNLIKNAHAREANLIAALSLVIEEHKKDFGRN